MQEMLYSYEYFLYNNLTWLYRISLRRSQIFRESSAEIALRLLKTRTREAFRMKFVFMPCIPTILSDLPFQYKHL